MNKTTNTQTTSARGLLAALIIALALAFAAIPSLVLAADADDEFTDAASDIVIEEDSPDDGATEPDQSPEPDADAPDAGPDPEPASYSLRLIVSADDDTLREGDTILGSHDGVHLLGFADGDSLAEAEAYYAESAAWSDRDIALTAADDEPTESAPAPVDETTNALTLLDESVGASSSSPAGEAGTPQPELPSAAEGGTAPLVALIDTGAPDDPSVVASATFVGDDPTDRHGHATAMLEAMKSENPDIRILAIKALGDDGEGSASSVYAAIEYATEQGADIINLSLAGYATDENAAIADAVARALENGITVIAAAGNGGYDAAYFTPANISGVFAVGACDEDGNVLESSNRGDCVSGYVAAESTSTAAARLTGWASVFGDRVLMECPFLFAPEDASYNGSNIPDPDPDGSLSASAVKYSGKLTIWPYGAEGSTVSWISRDGTSTKASQIKPSEKLYFFTSAAYSPGGVSYKTNPSTKNWDDKRLFKLGFDYGSATKKLPLHGVFEGSDGTGQQLISGQGLLSPSVENGTAVTGEKYAYFHFGYTLKVNLDPGTTGIKTTGTPTLYVVDFVRRNGEVLYDAGVFRGVKNGGYSSTPFDEMTKTQHPITVPTRNDGYTFEGYDFQYSGLGGSATVRVIDRYGYVSWVSDAYDSDVLGGYISTFTDGWDTKFTAVWEPDSMITLDDGDADLKGTTGLYVQGKRRVLVGPDATSDEFTTTRKISVPYRTGYKFEGYYTGKDGNGTLVITPSGTATTALDTSLGGATLYALWGNASETYTATLDDNGGFGGPGTFFKTIINTDVTGNYTYFLSGGVYNPYTALRVTCGLGGTDTPRMGDPSIKRFMGYNTIKDSASSNTMLLDRTLSNKSNGYYFGSCSINKTDIFVAGVSGGAASSYTPTGETTYYASKQAALRQDLTGNANATGWSAVNVTLSDMIKSKLAENSDNSDLLQYAQSSTSNPSTGSYNTPDNNLAGQWKVGGWGNLSVHTTSQYATYAEFVSRTYGRASYYAVRQLWWALDESGTRWTSDRSVGGTRLKTPYYFTDPTSTASASCSNTTAYATWGGWPLQLQASGGTINGLAACYEVYGTGFYSDELAHNKLNSFPTASRTGYTFQGWYQQENGSGLRVAAEDGTITKEPVDAYGTNDTSWCDEADVKYVYADWTPNTYTVTLELQGAPIEKTGTPKLFEVYDIGVFLSETDAKAATEAESADGLPAMSPTENRIDVPTWPHHVFMGYYAEPTGGERYIDEQGYVTTAFANNAFTEDATLYARWYDDRTVLPLAGGTAENMPLLWGSALAVVCATGLVLFRALRPNRADRRKAAHGAHGSAPRGRRKPARQALRASVRSNAVARPSVRTRHAR